jgi:putative addiction module component (TIGR02574 family)
MSLSLKQLEAAALALPLRERAQLVERLIASLDEDATEEDPADVDRAWAEEIQRRVAAVEAGTVELIPGEQVFAELRARPRG